MVETIDPGSRAWNYRGDEIIADGIVHGLGVLLAVAGTIVLLGFIFTPRDVPNLLAHVVYCCSLLLALTASAIYNMWPVSPLKWALRRVDHAMIFALIAGTYTPFLMRIGNLQTSLFLAAIWAASAAGMVLKLFDSGPGRRERLSSVLYMVLGWSGIFTLGALSSSVPLMSLVLLIGGGVLYSAGVIFHHWRSLRFQNAIWHGFVLAAAACHFAAVVVAADA